MTYTLTLMTPRATGLNRLKYPAVAVFPYARLVDISGQINTAIASAPLTLVKMTVSDATYASIAALATPAVAGASATYALLAYQQYDGGGDLVADTSDDAISAGDLTKHMDFLNAQWAAAHTAIQDAGLAAGALNSVVTDACRAALKIVDPGIGYDSPITSGGNNGLVFEVDNANASGSGSLYDALMTNAHRVVVVKTWGTIPVGAAFTAKPNLTLICEAPYKLCLRRPVILGDDSIVYGMRHRIGVPANNPGGDNCVYAGANNHLIKCSITWGADGNLGMTKHNVLVERCVVGEPIAIYNQKNIILIGPSVGTLGADDVTLYLNLICRAHDRNPTVFSGRRLDIYNDVIFDTNTVVHLQPRDSYEQVNLIGNYGIPTSLHPVSGSQRAAIVAYRSSGANPNPQQYIDASGQYLLGNVQDGKGEVGTYTQYGLIQLDSGVAVIAVQENPYPTIHIDQGNLIDVEADKEAFLDALLADAGPDEDDAVDARLKSLCKNRTASAYPTHQDDVGGYPDLTA